MVIQRVCKLMYLNREKAVRLRSIEISGHKGRSVLRLGLSELSEEQILLVIAPRQQEDKY